eukprot:3720982-Rhodomonas_salina.2
MGPVLLFSNAVRAGILVFVITVGLDALLIASSRLWEGEGGVNVMEEDTDTLGYALVAGLTTYVMMPPVVALFFRVLPLRASPLSALAHP